MVNFKHIEIRETSFTGLPPRFNHSGSTISHLKPMLFHLYDQTNTLPPNLKANLRNVLPVNISVCISKRSCPFWGVYFLFWPGLLRSNLLIHAVKFSFLRYSSEVLETQSDNHTPRKQNSSITPQNFPVPF